MRGAALLLLACGCLARARAQEDDDIEGSLVQEVTEVAQGGVDNGNNDVAVAGIWHDDSLYTAVQTTAFLTGNANAGENDVVLIKFSVDLEEEEIVQFGSEGDDLVTAMAGNIGVQGNFVIVGSTASESSPGVDHLFDNMVNGTYDPDQDASSDWFIATIDRDTLEVADSYVNGTLFENQQATAVAVDTEVAGTYYVAGWTWGEYFAENAGADNDDEDVGYDWWVVKINEFDQLVDPVWAEQGGSAAYDTPTAMVVDADAVYVVGTVRDDSNVLSTADEAEQTPIFVMALDVDDGDELWSATVDEVGTLADGTLAYGAVLSADGDELYVSGHTEGILPDYDGDATDSAELFLISFDVSDGSVNWVWQSEGNATAFGRGGVVLAEDGSPIVAGIAFGNQFNLTYEYWEGGNGDMIAAKIDPDDLEVVKYFNAPAAYNMTREEPFAMVTDPEVEDGVFLIGQQDGDFEDEDVEPELDPDVEDDDDATAANLNNYLVLKVELTDFPDPVDDSSDDGPDYAYWPISVAVFGIGIVLFYLAYKWAEHSKAAAAKMATMV